MNLSKNQIDLILYSLEQQQIEFNDAELKVAFEWLRKFGLFDLQDELTASLSYGQQKKLALIRVLARSSDLIILDEPLVGLDQATADQLTSFLIQKLSEGVSLILTSHINPMIDCRVLDIGANGA